ncbi:M1 family metallopeptidase [Fulvivirga sediminis]|uniref:M1 family metallopeptidase n=1 Tax=Fulvivirga sediminis TaxID=2803949 RepID=A0A937F698_9BACT|nr:M1 family metallopeptidase [Fulvivirga sediminis]MBL3654783.1 M1 family metallopeptidase [Fulvivirga sediminis]
MRKILLTVMALAAWSTSWAQEDWGQKFEQLGQQLPTPNVYRTGSGAPGVKYWQQQADYKIDVAINDKTQELTGSENIKYHNNSPDVLTYLWVQLDQNVRAKGNLDDITSTGTLNDSLPAKFFQSQMGTDASGYEGGYKIKAVKNESGKDLNYVINRTMMKVNLPEPLKSGDSYTFQIDWSYNIYDRMIIGGRGGYEYFPEDDNYAYTCAQWYPRMAVYDDYEGWQNKQFIGRGEFALTFGDFEVNITVPEDHIVAATGVLQNAKQVLSKTQMDRFEKAKKTYDKPVFIVTEAEAKANEKTKASKTKTWSFKADNVRDFAFASSRKYIWDAQAVKLPTTTPLAMSFYPKEGNPLWADESTKAIKNTLEIYSERTFDYPYPVAISVNAANQGMEYPMICFNYGRPVDGTISPRLLDGTVSVIVHEVGHNYFPMIVNSDERQWTWMDEGLNTFLEKETKRERYPDLDLDWGTPKGVIRYMKGDTRYITPIMTNSEQVKQFGYNAYGKPSAALTVLREVVMGPDLFDAAFKEYSNRWMFKHPKPADFFRTMEDASAVDLDWFWRGWFYSVDHVDVNLSNVQWFKMRNETGDVENKGKSVNEADLQTSSNSAMDFSKGPEPFSLIETDPRYYGEFQNKIDDNAVMKKFADKNFYQLTFKNEGGLVSPLIVKFTFNDGSSTSETIPAEIWRMNEQEVIKVFAFDKEVTDIVVDPEEKTGDTNTEDNIFPREPSLSKFDQFKSKIDTNAKVKVEGEWHFTTETPEGEITGSIDIKKKRNKYSGTVTTESSSKKRELTSVSLEGNVLKFSFEASSGAFTVESKVIVEGDQFNGNMSLGSYGDFDVTGRR